MTSCNADAVDGINRTAVIDSFPSRPSEPLEKVRPSLASPEFNMTSQ